MYSPSKGKFSPSSPHRNLNWLEESIESKMEKEVQALFRTRSVDEIRLQEANTRLEIEEKKQELRKLVGTRYRDLIDSADSIIDMRDLSKEVFTKIHSMEENCNKLSKKRSAYYTGEAQEKIRKALLEDTEKEPKRKKYMLGKHIKLLVDTPEEIWSALESHDFLKATQLYLEAERVRSELGKGDEYSAKVLSAIPLLSRQWATITQFPPKILAKSRSHLLRNHRSDQDYGGALVAVVRLGHVSPAQSLEEFLERRYDALETLLRQPLGTQQDDVAVRVQETLVTSMRILQETLSAVYRIFADSPPLLSSLLRESKGDPPSLEISAESLRKHTSEWLRRSAQIVHTAGGEWMQRLRSAAQLRTVSDLLFTSLRDRSPDWNQICVTATGESIDLWERFFRQLFLERAKGIISTSFQQISLEVPLKQTLTTLRHNSDAPDRSVGYYIWQGSRKESAGVTSRQAAGLTPELSKLLEILDNQLRTHMADLTQLLVAKTLDSDSPSDAVELEQFLRQSCVAAVCRFAETMKAEIIERQRKLLPLLRQPHNASLAAPGVEFSKQFPEVSSLLDESLFLARLCRAISSHSEELKKILPRPQSSSSTPSTPTRFPRTPTRSRSMRLVVEVSPEMRTVQEALAQPYLLGHLVWARSVVRLLGDLLGTAVAQDNWNDLHRSVAWEELTITVESEEDKDVEETVQLPFQPSAFLLSFFFAVAQELHRVGSHTVERSVVVALVCLTIQRVSDVYGTVGTAAKEGLLQLLIDCRFSVELTAARKAFTALGTFTEVTQSEELLVSIEEEYRKEIEQEAQEETGMEKPTVTRLMNMSTWTPREQGLIDNFEEQLDPIDIAFLDNPLRDLGQRALLRTGLLFGSLRLFSPSTGKVPKTSYQEQHNVLSLAPVAGRFNLLPVSTPPLKHVVPPASPVAHQVTTTTPDKENPKQSSFVNKLGSMLVGEKSSGAEKKGDSPLQNLWFL